jgi:hypothetical protein
MLGLASLGCASTEEKLPTQEPTFRGCIQGYDADYQPLTADELVDRAELIVRGRFQDVSDGRVANDTVWPASPLPMLVFRLQVSETLKGEPRDSAYLERMRGSCRADAATIPVPEEEVMLFLRPPGWDPEGYRFDYPDRGRPPGEPLWVLLTEQALLLESDGVASPILEPGDLSFPRASLDVIGADVRSRLAGP